MSTKTTDLHCFPDERGHFGEFGGIYVSESLMGAVNSLNQVYQTIKLDQDFWDSYYEELKNYVGRPTPLYFASRLSEKYGLKVYLKREDLCHTGAHKINNTIGQILLAKKLGKKRIIAETGAGQHGVSVATVAAKLDLECVIYMGSLDVERQQANVKRMKLLGAKVIEVDSGSKILKDAVNEAIRDWATNVDNTFYVIGTVVGMHPYPAMVRDFQKVIGIEAKEQIIATHKNLPDAILACVGGGSNAIGIFYDFLNDKEVELYGVEAAGFGLETGKNAAPLNCGKVGIVHGNKTYLMQDDYGQIIETHSISAGLDYPGVGPEHAWLKDIERAKYVAVDDKQAMTAFQDLIRLEGIIPAIESSHALAYLNILVADYKKDFGDISNKAVIVNISGRGDKDLDTALDYLKIK